MRRIPIIPMLVTLLVLAPTGLSAQSALGRWTLDVNWPNGPTTVTLTVFDSAGSRRARWEGPRGTLVAKNVHDEKDELGFVLPVQDQNGAPLELKVTLKFDAIAMQGALQAGQGQQVAIKGKRSARPSG